MVVLNVVRSVKLQRRKIWLRTIQGTNGDQLGMLHVTQWGLVALEGEIHEYFVVRHLKAEVSADVQLLR